MLALELRFPAGRYHATPWGRHVNEGEVDWPPAPWRLLRGLIATWHHKLKPVGTHSEATLEGLIAALAETPPEYCLPPASHSHTRHYLPQWAAGNTKLVFDAFAAVDRDTPLHLRWPQLELEIEQTELLDALLDVIGYLGRAESWLEARRVSSTPVPNCIPSSETVDVETGEVLGEVVQVHAPLPATVYAEHRQKFLVDKRQAKKLAATLPASLLDALSLDTADLQKLGWSQPPASRQIAYVRPLDALRPQRPILTIPRQPATTVRFLLVGKPLPRVEDSLRIGELLRWAVMSAFGKNEADRHLAPPIFSGHDLPNDNRHGHAFYLPFDSTGDGRLDRVLIHVPAGFSGDQRSVIERLRKLWQRDGSQWRLILEGIGNTQIGGTLTNTATRWISATPYLHPWHFKKHFTVEDQIRRECRERGLPEPETIEVLPSICLGGRERRPIHFQRFRSRRGLHQADRRGSLLRLTFPKPVSGPLALGFACHFGMGLFKPESKLRGLLEATRRK